MQVSPASEATAATRAGDSFTNTPTRLTKGGSPSVISRTALGGDGARAARPEHEPERRGAELHRQHRILTAGDAADFHAHRRFFPCVTAGFS